MRAARSLLGARVAAAVPVDAGVRLLVPAVLQRVPRRRAGRRVVVGGAAGAGLRCGQFSAPSFRSLTAAVQLWLLAVSSLYKCLFTRPPTIPPAFGVPARLVRLLSSADRRDYRASELHFSSGSESDGSGPGGASSGSGSDGEGDATHKWEAFYRGLVALAKKRQLKARTS